MPTRFWATSSAVSAVDTTTAEAFGPLARAARTDENDDDVGIEYHPGCTDGVPATMRSRRNAS